MLDPQASRFWRAALLSDLMDAQSLRACWNAIPAEKRDQLEHLDRRLARKALDARLLTRWQAQHLLAGRTKGFKVDRYVLLDMINEGGMGRVYLASDTRLKRQVALKVLSPDRMNKPRSIARFRREALAGAQLHHENLVHILDFGEANGRHFLVMEYIEGTTVGSWIAENGLMPPATAVRIVRQVALGLEHLHQKGLIHRDVNPRNILVTSDGNAKLADLGLAIDLDVDDRVTREGATLGTFDYMAPEQARDSHAADIRSDIYSLGCTLYQMIGGKAPFRGGSLAEKLIAHRTIDPAPLNQLAPGLSNELAGIVARMMRKSPDERYDTPSLLAQALKRFENPSNCTEELVARSTESPASLGTPERDAGSSGHDLPVLVAIDTEPSLSARSRRKKSRVDHALSTTAGSTSTSGTSAPETVTSSSDDSARIPWRLSIWFRRLVPKWFPGLNGSDTSRYAAVKK
jgi:serine/threonine-protein kinase